MQTETLVISVDERQAVEASGRARRAVDDYRKAGVQANKDVAASAADPISALDRIARTAQRQSEAVKIFGMSFENAMHGAAAGVRGVADFTAAVLLSTRALTAHVTALSAIEGAMNRVRVARIGFAGFVEGLGGALTVATEVGAILAVEKVAKASYERSKEIQAQALASQKTGFKFEDTSALSFASQRIGQPPDFFDSAVKSAGGVDQLAKRLRELADVRDPLVRAELAFKEFGPDAEKVLASLGDRFGDNAERAKSWGIALDQETRGKIDLFRRDVDNIRGTFDSWGDSIGAVKKQLGALFELDLSGIWELLTRGPGALIGAIKPPIAFSTNTLDLKGAQRSITGRAGQDALASAQQEMLRSLTAPAEKAFQKSYFDRDQEADLRSEIEQLRKRLFVQDRTSADFGKLVSGASFPGGQGARAESLQKLTSDQGQLDRVVAAKKTQVDADEAAKKAAQELEGAQRSVAASLQAAQLSELTGATKLRAERDIALDQYGKTKDLVRDINKEFDIKFGLEGKSIIDQSAVDMRKRADAEAKAQADILNARSHATAEAFIDSDRLYREGLEKRATLSTAALEADRDQQLRSLDVIGAQTLAAKIAVEAKKSSIEIDYLRKSEELEEDKIDRVYALQLTKLKNAFDARLITQKAFEINSKNLEINESLDIAELRASLDAKIAAARDNATIQSAKLTQEQSRSVFDTFKRESEGIFDATLRGGRNVFQALGDSLKNALLTAVKDVVSSRVAASLTELVTGEKVTLEPGNVGKGPLGKVAGALGVGSHPVFGNQAPIELKTKLDLSNHLGDLQLVSGGAASTYAAPVFVVNQQQAQQQQQPQNVRNTLNDIILKGALGLGLAGALGGLGGGRGGGATAATSQTISYAADSGDLVQSFPETLAGNPASLIGPGGTSGFAGPLGGSSGGGGILQTLGLGGGGGGTTSGTASGGGILGSLKGILGIGGNGGSGGGGLLGILKGLGGIGMDKGGVPGVGDAPGTDLGGGLFGSQGIGGVGGGLLLAGGGIAAFDGLRRGGIGGLLETTAGGAAIGAKFGGPIGALIGAGVGALAGTIRLFVKGATEKAHDKIKDAYGVDISDKGILTQIVGIAKQNYGGNIDVAIRTPEVRQLIELYAMSTGQNQKGIVDRPVASTFTNSGGVLSATPNYFDGQAVMPGDLSSKTGVPYLTPTGYITPNPPQAANTVGVGASAAQPVIQIQSVQLQVNGGAAADALEGRYASIASQQIASNPRGISSAAAVGQTTGAGRRETAASVLAPSLITA